MRTILSLIGPMLAALLLGGCVGAKAPLLRPVDVALTSQSEEAVVLTYGIEALNVAETDLPLVEMRYDVRAGGETVYRGRHALQRTIPRDAAARLDIPVVLPFSETGGRLAQVQELAVSGTLYYIRPGQLAQALFDAGLVVPTTNVSWEHALDMEALVEQPLTIGSND